MAICNHQVDSPLYRYIWPDVCSGDLQAHKRDWSYKTPYVLTETGVTKQKTKKNKPKTPQKTNKNQAQTPLCGFLLSPLYNHFVYQKHLIFYCDISVAL